MTDTSAPQPVNEPDPEKYTSGTTAGAFWFELILRNANGTHEVRLSEVVGEVTVEGATLTVEEFDKTLASTLEHLAGVIRCGRQ